MMLTARAISRAERAWLREVLGEDAPDPGAAHPSSGPDTLDERVS
ncbi:hypothetical protein [Streptomyces hawaiiensis]